MSPQPFVSHEPAELRYCQDCGQHYWTDHGHPCDEGLRGGEGIVRAVVISLLLILLVVLVVEGRWP